MNKTTGEKLFLIKWLSDFQLEITSGYQIETIRYSESKCYNSEP